MKKVIVLLAAALTGLQAQAQTTNNWSADKSHSKIGFTISHMVISEVDGFFKDFTATLTNSKEDFSDSRVEFTAKAASVFTDDDKRDQHLQSEDFFFAQKYPDVTFKSTSFKKVGDRKYKMTGNFTMRGVTKTETFDVEYMGTTKSPWGTTVAAFKINGKVNRKEYGLNWSKSLDTGGLVTGDDVTIACKVEMIKK